MEWGQSYVRVELQAFIKQTACLTRKLISAEYRHKSGRKLSIIDPRCASVDTTFSVVDEQRRQAEYAG